MVIERDIGDRHLAGAGDQPVGEKHALGRRRYRGIADHPCRGQIAKPRRAGVGVIVEPSQGQRGNLVDAVSARPAPCREVAAIAEYRDIAARRRAPIVGDGMGAQGRGNGILAKLQSGEFQPQIGMLGGIVLLVAGQQGAR